MEYSGEAFNVPKQWNFRRTWTDFVALDTALRSDPRFMRVAGSDLLPVPDRPYLIGEGADARPFQRYLEALLLKVRGAIGYPAVYAFVELPDSVLVSAFPGRVPIDIPAVQVRSADAGPRDPPEQAGRGVRDAKQAIAEAEIARNAGVEAAKIKAEVDKAAAEVGKVVN
eukprot:CAMPEP_0172212214 /NCGR_PEP_ID=MMETSP1050-20130122/36866_1 /TAXON_ID=233186 /ORGANISM="Cryptomonas curvata, Strain CCAP979/52" /LENGTH=168 /DNA_ID=CAMNT_0012892817 /DNA_START=206 /DNA_END=710 /DNA_ORIENTATION=+